MNALTQLLRIALFFVLAIFGMAMAFIFMVSTAIAVAVLYVVARIKGRPFGVRAYWDARTRSRPMRKRTPDKDIIDVEMRELP